MGLRIPSVRLRHHDVLFVIPVNAVIRSNPQPPFVVLHDRHQRLVPKQRMVIAVKPVHGKVGHKQRSLFGQEVKIVEGILVNHPDFFLMDESLGKDICLDMNPSGKTSALMLPDEASQMQSPFSVQIQPLREESKKIS